MEIIRKIKWFFQKLFHGFNDSDLWDLDLTLAKFILPRLEAFRKMDRNGWVPVKSLADHLEMSDGVGSKLWDETLDKMIAAFKLLADEDITWITKTEENNKIIAEGLKLFIEYFQHLWD